MLKLQHPYLIQRGKFKNREEAMGLNSILTFDYMGSSEFEWGALPKSLGRIRDEHDKYVMLDFAFNGKTITVWCKANQNFDELKVYLIGLAQNNYNLKEYSDFDNYIFPNDRFKTRNTTDFWWDLKNDIMFWRKNNEFEVKFKELIK